jgi:hypothetical protein
MQRKMKQTSIRGDWLIKRLEKSRKAAKIIDSKVHFQFQVAFDLLDYCLFADIVCHSSSCLHAELTNSSI